MSIGQLDHRAAMQERSGGASGSVLGVYRFRVWSSETLRRGVGLQDPMKCFGTRPSWQCVAIGPVGEHLPDSHDDDKSAEVRSSEVLKVASTKGVECVYEVVGRARRAA